jgi:hypothetical protein
VGVERTGFVDLGTGDVQLLREFKHTEEECVALERIDNHL